MSLLDCVPSNDGKFLCGRCMWETYKTLEERIAMAESLKEGDNICNDCGFNVSKTFEYKNGKKGSMKINFSRRSKY